MDACVPSNYKGRMEWSEQDQPVKVARTDSRSKRFALPEAQSLSALLQLEVKQAHIPQPTSPCGA